MQTTGIVRKLDDLGRITIPQNIKKRLNITGGDKLEVFLMSDGVAFKKYSALGEDTVARKCCIEFNKITGKLCFVTDKDGVMVTDSEIDNKLSLKNKAIINDVVNVGSEYNGLDSDKSMWITIFPLGERGKVAETFIVVHGKQENPNLHTLIKYTAGIIGSDIVKE